METTYTISEAAQILGVHPSTLRRWERSGHITSMRVPDGWRRFTESEIVRLGGDVHD